MLGGAVAPPARITLFTALPLMWGEGGVSDILRGRVARSAMLDGLEVRAIDTVSSATLGRDIVVVAQPRAMASQEFVALDAWVRSGGRALIFDDPLLVWPSRYSLGDARRAPPVGLLDPLLAHWGVHMASGENGVTTRDLDGFVVATAASGQWLPGSACSAPDALTLDCHIGSGRAMLIADADLLDVRLAQDTTGANADWLKYRIRALAENRRLGRDSASPHWVIIAALTALIFSITAFWHKIIRTQKEHISESG